MSFANLENTAGRETIVAFARKQPVPRPRAEPDQTARAEPEVRGRVAFVRRAVGLAADGVLLVLAAPFLAVWWAVRLSRRLMGKT